MLELIRTMVAIPIPCWRKTAHWIVYSHNSRSLPLSQYSFSVPLHSSFLYLILHQYLFIFNKVLNASSLIRCCRGMSSVVQLLKSFVNYVFHLCHTSYGLMELSTLENSGATQLMMDLRYKPDSISRVLAAPMVYNMEAHTVLHVWFFMMSSI